MNGRIDCAVIMQLTFDPIYKKLLLNTPQLCCGDENSIAEGDKV